jgi:F-type H+-transporting ATPase subunit gamma
LPLDEKWRAKAGQSSLPEVMGVGNAALLALIRECLFVSMFRACDESLARENSSRVAAMQRTDKKIDECWMASTGHSPGCARERARR